MRKCLICLELNKDELDYIQIESATWDELNVKSIIEKHLWSMDTFKSKSQCICSYCWQELNDFHKFYNRIKAAQLNCDECTVKTESDILEEKPVLENLVEPEIVIDHTDVVHIKKERQEIDSNNDEDDMPLILMCQSSHTRSELSSNESSKYMEDPLNKPLDEGKTMRRRKRVAAKYLKQTKRVTKGKNNEEDERESKKKDMKNGNMPLPSVDIKNSKSCAKSYYQPRTNRQEHDKFLAQHSKLICYICQESFETFHKLLKHFAKVHKQRGYVTCCEAKYYDRSKLFDHINFHLNPEYFKCKYCPKVLAQRKSLRAHMLLHEERRHTCDICQKKFVERCKLALHKLTHMPEEEKNYPCGECGKLFASDVLLSHHQTAVHINKKLCDICGQSVGDLDTFKRHMEKHEGIQSTTFSCDICGLVVAGKRNLKLHTNSQHPEGGKKEYPCHICYKVSPTLNALRKHIRCTHEMGYNYKCTICEKAFKRPDNLKAHMAAHTGTDLYKCPWCRKTFNSNANMHHHRKKVHPKEWEEARRKRYSGNLPPNFKPPPSITENVTKNVPIS